MVDLWSEVRDIQKVDYTATHKDYNESIDALERAIAVLKTQNFNRKQAEKLIEVPEPTDENGATD